MRRYVSEPSALSASERRKERKRLTKVQNGKCWLCGASLRQKPTIAIRRLPLNKGLFPKGFFSHPVHLHHDHTTGKSVGVVHALCNGVLWEYFGQ